MEIDTRCPVCWRLDEDGGHCFLKCKIVKKVWRNMNLEDIRCQLADLRNAEEVVKCILSLDEKRGLLVAALLRFLPFHHAHSNAGDPLMRVEVHVK